MDHEAIMDRAQINNGCFTREMMSLEGWSSERFDLVVLPLLQEGMLWIDEHQGKCTHTYYSITFSA